MAVVVAGGAGFLGSHVCDALLAAGNEVVCLDNLSTGRARNVEHLRDERDFRYIESDIVEPLPDALGHVEAVLQLASPASPPGYRERPIETLRVNAEGTRRLLELAHAQGARFLLASTSEVY